MLAKVKKRRLVYRADAGSPAKYRIVDHSVPVFPLAPSRRAEAAGILQLSFNLWKVILPALSDSGCVVPRDRYVEDITLDTVLALGEALFPLSALAQKALALHRPPWWVTLHAARRGCATVMYRSLTEPTYATSTSCLIDLTKEAIVAACRGGNENTFRAGLDCLRKLVCVNIEWDRMKFVVGEAFVGACSAGAMNLVKELWWMLRRAPICDLSDLVVRRALCAAVKHGHVGVFDFVFLAVPTSIKIGVGKLVKAAGRSVNVAMAEHIMGRIYDHDNRREETCGFSDLLEDVFPCGKIHDHQWCIKKFMSDVSTTHAGVVADAVSEYYRTKTHDQFDWRENAWRWLRNAAVPTDRKRAYVELQRFIAHDTVLHVKPHLANMTLRLALQVTFVGCTVGALDDAKIMASILHDMDAPIDDCRECFVPTERGLGYAEFMAACGAGHLETVQWLCSYMKPETREYLKSEALCEAVCNGSGQVAAWVLETMSREERFELVEFAIIGNQARSHGRGLYHRSNAMVGQHNGVEFDPGRWASLVTAFDLKSSDLHSVSRFVDYGCEHAIHLVEPYFCSPFSAACAYGQMEIVRMFLDRLCCVPATELRQWRYAFVSACAFAGANGYLEVLQLMHSVLHFTASELAPLLDAWVLADQNGYHYVAEWLESEFGIITRRKGVLPTHREKETEVQV